jgi:hypothetical protein
MVTAIPCATWITEGISTYSSIPWIPPARGPVQAAAMLKKGAKRESSPPARPMISTSLPRALYIGLSLPFLAHHAGDPDQLLDGLNDFFPHPGDLIAGLFLRRRKIHISSFVRPAER